MSIVLVLAFGAIYLLPTMLALIRNHGSWRAIMAVNLLLGWSLIGWLIALFWSLSDSGRVTRELLREVHAMRLDITGAVEPAEEHFPILPTTVAGRITLGLFSVPLAWVILTGIYYDVIAPRLQ